MKEEKMNVTQTMEGERVDGVPVLAWMRQEETPLGPMPRLAFHWSTPPKNVAITRLVDAAALAAAPPAPVDEVRAKPLEWKGTEPHVFAYDEATRLGYEILRRNDGSFSLRKPGEGFVKSEIDNEEGLKRYCQSDYETRIRSALVSPPATSTDCEEAKRLVAKYEAGEPIMKSELWGFLRRIAGGA
jgi:hypothetical protein